MICPNGLMVCHFVVWGWFFLHEEESPFLVCSSSLVLLSPLSAPSSPSFLRHSDAEIHVSPFLRLFISFHFYFSYYLLYSSRILEPNANPPPQRPTQTGTWTLSSLLPSQRKSSTPGLSATP